MIKEAIILAGGLGTRLKGVISDIPKPLAPISGKPFLTYLLEYLDTQKLERVVLSVGYKHEMIEQAFGNQYKNLHIQYSIETEPLGTGGAIKLAMDKIVGSEVLILNGDSFIEVNLQEFNTYCKNRNAQFAITLKEMTDFDRYGTVEFDGQKILCFNEKKPVKKGWINSGVYFLKKDFFETLSFPEKFSFEKEFLEKYYSECDFSGYVSNGYFIDIGIPEDYDKAQEELPEIIRITA